jgi:hypothetical protein
MISNLYVKKALCFGVELGTAPDRGKYCHNPIYFSQDMSLAFDDELNTTTS